MQVLHYGSALEGEYKLCDWHAKTLTFSSVFVIILYVPLAVHIWRGVRVA